MKKKLNAMIAMLLCTACLPLAPMKANAVDIDVEYYNNDDYTVETDSFTYRANGTGHFSYDVDSFEVKPALLVTGVYRSDDGTIEGYSVFGLYPMFDGGRGDLYLEDGKINTLLDGKELQVGDVIGSKNVLTTWNAHATYPTTFFLTTSLVPSDEISVDVEFLGNGVDLFGEEFTKVIRHEMTNTIDDSMVILGDITEDEKVDAVDVLIMNQYLLGVRRFNSYRKLAADVNHDGAVSDSDSMTILKSLVGLEELQ